MSLAPFLALVAEETLPQSKNNSIKADGQLG